MNVILTNYTKNSIDTIEQAACNCYNSKPAGGKIAKSCYKSGHQSVFEFVDFTFHIEGVSRALLAQLTRHRMASFAVRSQRYVNEQHFDYIIPNSIRKEESLLKQYNSLMDNINNFYQLACDLNIPKEDARFVLPNACETIIEFKCNGRELIHFMNERLCTRAQWEIRELAQNMKKAVEEIDIDFSKYLVPKCEKNPDLYFCTESKSCGKHKILKEVAGGMNE